MAGALFNLSDSLFTDPSEISCEMSVVLSQLVRLCCVLQHLPFERIRLISMSMEKYKRGLVLWCHL